MENRYLFRGKRIDTGKWVEGHLITDETDDSKCFIGYVIGTDEDGAPHDLDVVQVDPSTICRCTGVDKNDELIWENDIVKFGYAMAPIKYGSYQCCFDSAKTEHVGFYVDWTEIHNYRKDVGYWIHETDTAVIGNTIDNPELLRCKMERLTKRSKNSDMVWYKDVENCGMLLEPCEMSSHHNRMAIAKLAAYEDLGYTPEELKLCFDPPEVLYEIRNETEGERVHPIYPVGGEQIEFAKGDVYWNCRDSFGDYVEIPLGGLHKEYFLDKAEAETKLMKEMEDSHDRE